MSQLKPVGLILDSSDTSYATMTKVGRVEISVDSKGSVWIVTGDFEFSDPPTCRTHSVRAMRWARDILDARIKQEELFAGEIHVAVD